MACYRKHAGEDTIRNPSLVALAKQQLEGAKQQRLPEQPEDSFKALIKLEVSLKTKLNDDLRRALKERDKCRSSVIRLLLSAIHNVEIARRDSLEDSDILGVIAKETRQRKESIEAFKKGNRLDLVAQEEAELAILETYLPKQMSHDEIVSLASKVINEVGAQDRRDMGRVMGKLMPQLKGKADGKIISEIVTELLS
ncbi:MAG: GatB/YqeY domain-containing protein [Dehalococcoidia bacterium]|nr:MAG: GatB/YqeY domain-containing protein [Dehalococcoidia bacterium]